MSNVTPTSSSSTSNAKETAPPPGQKQARLPFWVSATALGAVVAAVFIIVTRHFALQKEVNASKASATETTVEVANYQPDTKPHDLILPGNVQAYQAATLYARTNGYIKAWYKDIGAKVKEGDLIAEITAPDVDAQLGQAQANLAQAQANLDIANLNFMREKDLLNQKVVSQQDYDTARTSLEAQQGAVKAGEANVQNLLAQQSFEKIVAPFTGTITQRNIDVGDLVSAGSASAGTLLFQLQQSDPLRIYVYVPQTNAPDIQTGMQAKVLVSEYPGRDFQGVVVRTAGAIDPASRTLLTEVDIPNPDGALYAGMYAQVKFTLEAKSPPFVVPANVFRFRAAGPQVATIVDGNKIHWVDVKVGRDFGTKIELVSGVDSKMPLVTNPTDDLQEGEQVTVKQAPPPAAAKGDANGQAPSTQAGAAKSPDSGQGAQQGGGGK